MIRRLLSAIRRGWIFWLNRCPECARIRAADKTKLVCPVCREGEIL
jgi:ssDNA-binding Zn-finger/Zn-ribbon topoisomerase 1